MEATSLLAQLHAPLLSLLHVGLSHMTQPIGWVVDVAAGTGEKLPLLRSVFGPDVPIVELDIEPAVFGNSTRLGVVGDAQALPFRSNSCAAGCCIASLGLFGEPLLALAEMERILRPGGEALVLTSASLWAQTIPWPLDVAQELAHRYIDALDAGAQPLAASSDLAGPLTEQMERANFTPLVRAFWLDRLPKADASVVPELASMRFDCVMAELPLLPWPSLRELLAPQLSSKVLHLCDNLAEEPQIEPCLLGLLAVGRKRR